MSEGQESDFDYEGYAKALERSLALAEKDYWTQYVDINRHQVNVSKTYLWVAAALLGAYAAAIGKYPAYFLANGCSVLFSLVAILSAVVAFGICLYAMPARRGYKAIPDVSWGEFPALANDHLRRKEKNIYVRTLTALNDKVDKANHHNVATNQSRASLLRVTSWVLIASFVLALLTGISISVPFLIKAIKAMEVVMPEETQNQSQGQSSESVPDVPAPAGPIYGGNPDLATHSVEPTRTGTIRITESDNSLSREEK
ncbi:hypothetical protein [Pseudomonas sp.]|uniref:hypothetical protein n=1 Tax=Pseudomonas sp. TaxID=306 RepID=UPI001A0258F8|nr:hypothetical protein [Pseudomonas sp.]MBF0676016.1 hypothetical protein [Pseudomonas sp.]